MGYKNWPLLVVILEVGLLAALWDIETDPGIMVLLRLTAQISLGLFLFAWLAAIAVPRGADIHFFRAFVISHAIHGVIIVTRLVIFEPTVPMVTMAGGGLAYGLIAVIGFAAFFKQDITEPDFFRRNRLHLYGSYYIWLIMAITVMSKLPTDFSMGRIALSLSLLVALVIRLRYDWAAPR